MKEYEIRSFLERFADDTYTEEEHQAFIEYLQTIPIGQAEAIADEYLSIAEKKPEMGQASPQLVGEIEKALDQWDLGNEQRARLVSIRRFKRIAAAAILIGMVVLSGAYILLTGQPAKEIVQSNKTQIHAAPIVPGGDKAILTLADGSQIILDSAANGALTRQGGVKVMKMGGQLAYAPETKTTEVLYNTVTTPRGGQYQLVLADGTKVWLNAASSLRFPATFTGKDRRVELTGEGYFEVASLKDPDGRGKMPFIVSVPSYSSKESMEIQVLGTHFNINSYEEEPSVKTTLLEGMVKVVRRHPQGEKFVLLHPGQQAEIVAGQNGNDIRIRPGVDVEEVMAWKNGKFQFGEAMDMGAIMRQLARWYDIGVEYRGKVTGHIGGTISRSVNLSQVLRMLEMTGVVTFQIEGRKIVVMPK